jgi:glutamate dehydrogenase (NAD(P)+)
MREGARVIGVSNVHGALHDPSGLNVERLLALRARHGDAALERYEGGTRSARDTLFSLPCDVLVPGARPDSLHRGNVGSVSAFLVVPAANIPYAEGALPALEKRGIRALPDFVTNAGGVLGVLAGMGGLEMRAIFDMVRDRIRENVDRMFDAARDEKTTLYAAALDLARKAILDSA